MQPLGPETTGEIAAIAREKGCRLLAIESAGAGRALGITTEHANSPGSSPVAKRPLMKSAVFRVRSPRGPRTRCSGL